MTGDEVRRGVPVTNPDQPLFDGAEATKRDLLDYLEAVGERLVRVLRDRPLSVVRVRPGQEPLSLVPARWRLPRRPHPHRPGGTAGPVRPRR
jgi:hypothetical protein